jgi:hypothetical protein
MVLIAFSLTKLSNQIEMFSLFVLKGEKLLKVIACSDNKCVCSKNLTLALL